MPTVSTSFIGSLTQMMAGIRPLYSQAVSSKSKPPNPKQSEQKASIINSGLPSSRNKMNWDLPPDDEGKGKAEESKRKGVIRNNKGNTANRRRPQPTISRPTQNVVSNQRENSNEELHDHLGTEAGTENGIEKELLKEENKKAKNSSSIHVSIQSLDKPKIEDLEAKKRLSEANKTRDFLKNYQKKRMWSTPSAPNASLPSNPILSSSVVSTTEIDPAVFLKNSTTYDERKMHRDQYADVLLTQSWAKD